MDIVKLAKDNEKLCIEMRRDLHKIPELELNLPKTVKYVKEKLADFGISYKEFIKGNGLVATIYGSEDGKCLAIRCDMDALPIKEETNLSFKSIHEGKMHACGHDSHTAIALTAAKIINENKDKLKGSVKFIFQPGEEVPGGARPMIEEGCLEKPKVDRILGLHGGKLVEMPSGVLAFKEDEIMASMDIFSIKVKGKGGHGANPQLTVDPIIISGEILLGLQKIISREIAPTERALISVCKINGGSTQNIIPDEVNMLGTSRALSEETRTLIEKRIAEVSYGIAKTYGGSAETVYKRYYPVLKNHKDFTNYVKDLSEELFPGEVFDLKEPTMGGEDMAFYQQEVPGTFFFLSNLKKSEDGNYYPNHNSKFDLDESLFYKGVAVFVATAFDFLK